MSALDRALGCSTEALRALAEEWAARTRAKETRLAAERSTSLRIVRPRRLDEGAATCGCLVRRGRVVQPCAVAWKIHDAIADLWRIGPGLGSLIEQGERAWDRHIETASGEQKRRWKRPTKRAEGG